MDNLKFAGVADFDPVLLVVLALLIIVWSTTRPAMIRDYDNRRLPPNTMARVLFTFLAIGAYVAVVASFLVFSDFATSVLKIIPGLEDHLQKQADKGTQFVRSQAPWIGALVMAYLLQLHFFREIERSVLIWLHSRRHVHDDFVALAQHLETSAFTPTEEERRRNRDLVMKYGVHVTDDSFDSVGLVTFINWRKVSTLLRLLRVWNNDERRTLSREEMKHLADLEKSHERKTLLQMTIVKMVADVEKGGETSKALSDLVKMLSSTPHVDRDKVAAVEAHVKTMFSDSDDLAYRPVRLTGQQLKNYLKQIESYFQVEYEILLQQVSELAAKSVVLSGESAVDHLKDLKDIGFPGLGRIETINFDRVLWIFLVVGLGGFLVFFLGTRNMDANMAEGIARFSLVMALASLIGTIVGSRRRYAQAQDTPWSRYFAAGVVAGAMFVGITYLTFVIKESLGVERNPNQLSLVQMVPWATLPCLVTIAIARLARLEAWPTLPKLAGYQNIVERVADGLCVTLALFLAFCISVALHTPLGLPLPPGVLAAMRPENILPIPIMYPLQIFGFLIGFFVVRDVRRAAHAQIISTRVVPQVPATEPMPAGAPAHA